MIFIFLIFGLSTHSFVYWIIWIIPMMQGIVLKSLSMGFKSLTPYWGWPLHALTWQLIIFQLFVRHPFKMLFCKYHITLPPPPIFLRCSHLYFSLSVTCKLSLCHSSAVLVWEGVPLPKSDYTARCLFAAWCVSGCRWQCLELSHSGLVLLPSALEVGLLQHWVRALTRIHSVWIALEYSNQEKPFITFLPKVFDLLKLD